MKEKLNTALNQTTTMDILQFIVNKMDGKVITLTLGMNFFRTLEKWHDLIKINHDKRSNF